MQMTICGRVVDPGHPLFVIAELGLNHAGDPQRALQLVDAAAAAGASAVKVQSFRAERLVGPRCPAPAHVSADSLQAFFQGYELDARAHALIAERAHRRGLAFVATPFDEDVVQELEAVGCDAYKIASGDITHHRLIGCVAATGKPVLISTGMSSLDDVRAAVACARSAGGRRVATLHCVSAYPVPAGEENLRAVAELARATGLPAGLSDHSTEPLSAPLAVALGAVIYERHLALDTDDEQIERAVSSTPSELLAIVESAERARRALGDGVKACRGAEADNRLPSRRSLHARRALVAGQVLDREAVVALRPAGGIDPRRFADVIGRRLVRNVALGAPIHEDDLAAAVEEGLGEAA